jgi:hypothetical protein
MGLDSGMPDASATAKSTPLLPGGGPSDNWIAVTRFGQIGTVKRGFNQLNAIVLVAFEPAA